MKLDITFKNQIPFLIPQGQMDRDDFAPVRETAAAIHFLSFLDDEKQYKVTKENGGYKGELKVRFIHAPDLDASLKELEANNEITIKDYHTAALVDIYKVYTLTLRANSEASLDEEFEARINNWKESIAKGVSDKVDYFNLVSITLGGTK